MKALLLLSSLSIAAAGFSWSDCGKPNAAVKMLSLTEPVVIENGNRYQIKAVFNVTRPLDATAQISYVAQRDDGKGNGFKAFPNCYGDMGTCKFGVCARPGHPAFNPLFYACTGTGAAGKIAVATYTVNDYIFFPGLSGMEIGAVKGDFKGVATLSDASGNELGCWNYAFTFKSVPSKC